MSEAEPHGTRHVTQRLLWGAVRQERTSPADTLYASTGRRLYVLGDIDGQFRPRSNPYDLHSFGKPHPDDPLAEKLQGVWAQPVKGFAGFGYTVEINGKWHGLRDAARFTQSYASVEFVYEPVSSAVPLRAVRRDTPALDLPVLFSTLTLQNNASQSLALRVRLSVQFDLQDAWFTSLGARRNRGQTVTVEGSRLTARAEVLPERWAAAAGCLQPAESVRVLDGEGGWGEITCRVELEPGAEETITFAMVVEAEGGAAAALVLLDRTLPQAQELLEEKQALYTQIAQAGPRLVSPDAALNEAFNLARANLQVLEAEQPPMGRYFYAGLEIFPFWFSNDGAYSVTGLMAAGLREPVLNHLEIGLRHLGEGRIPHQISPSGKVAFQGNTQETPQWVMSIWDAFRWTGDRDFLVRMFDGVWKGMFEYVLGTIDSDGDGYPSGPGMVEVEGMGAEKLDSAAYTWAALHALANMAQTLGKKEQADQARARAEDTARRFDGDWWDEAGGTYSMSLEDPGNARLPLPHWAVIVPLEVGLATEAHAQRTFAALRADYLNRWGLKHTVGSDERVWTLPTATLARAAYRYGEPQMGFTMLRSIAATQENGSIGLFHELIPEGACIVQLWSAATFLRGIIEDLLGIEVRADLLQLRVNPRLPAEWSEVTLEDLTFGDHHISLRCEQKGVTVRHHTGTGPITVRYGEQSFSLPVGETSTFKTPL